MTDVPEERRRRHISELYFLQIVANILALGVIIALLISAIGQVAHTAAAQEKANRAVIDEIQRDLTIHAGASAIRSCAVAKEIRYAILALSPQTQPIAVQQKLAHYVELACHVEILIRPDGHSSADGHTTTETPVPSRGPSPSPPQSSPHPSTAPPPTTTTPPPPPPSSPSPTVICLPVLGCV